MKSTLMFTFSVLFSTLLYIFHFRYWCCLQYRVGLGMTPRGLHSGSATPLITAIDYRQTEVVRLLLAAEGIDVNAATSCGTTTLALAVRRQQTKIVRMLLAVEGIHINSQDRYGNTPLHEAIRDGGNGVIPLLLAAKGVDFTLANKNGIMLLQKLGAKACTRSDTFLLLRAGARIGQVFPVP